MQYTHAYPFTKDGNPGFGYQSGMMSFAEMLVDGQLVGCGFQGNGMGVDILSSILNAQPSWIDPASHDWPFTFRLEIDGQALISNWEFRGFEQTPDERGTTVGLRLAHARLPVEVTVRTRLDGTAVLSRTLVVHNVGERDLTIGRVSPMSGALEQCQAGYVNGRSEETPYEAGYMRNPQWANEGEFGWSTLPMASTHISGRYPDSEHRHPIAFVRNTQTGAYYIIQVAWSGGYEIALDVSQNLRKYHSFERTDNEFVTLGFEAGPSAPAPMRVVAPGERYETPEVHVGMVVGTLDDAVAENHAHLRGLLRMGPSASLAYVQNAIYPGVPMDDEFLDRSIRISRELGVDVFFIDAGWYSPPEAGGDWGIHAGDWEFRRFGRTVDQIRDRVHEAGMKFGLWMEPERLGSLSTVYRDHPDWTTTRYQGDRLGLEQLDVARPEVAAHVEESMVRVIRDYGLDFFRLDFNLDHLNESAYNDIRGFKENHYARYYENLYGILSRLRAAFPRVIFENCASGGARTDIGILRHFDHTWVSDWVNAPRSFRIVNGMTVALPPETVDRFMIGNYGTWAGSMDFNLDLLLFARPTLGSIESQDCPPNPILLDRLKKRVAFYKAFVVPFLPGCRVYHHTDTHRGAHPEGLGILEYTAADKSRGILGVFGLAGCATEDLVVRPKGPDLGRTYRITYLKSGETRVESGLALLRDGLPVVGLGPVNSQVVAYEEVGP